MRWFLLVPTLAVLIAFAVAVVGTAMQISAGGPTPGRRSLAVLSRESFGRLVILALSPLGWIPAGGPRAGAGDPERAPLLLIPGYGTNRSAFWFLTQYLAHRGWGWLWPVNHAGKEVLLEGQAKELERRVLELKRRTGAEKIDILGFSMGGLVAAWFVTHLDGAAHVRRLITVGTPWSGTRFAKWASTPVGAQVGWESPTLAGLDPTAVETIAIWSPDDPVVIPASSAAPEGARSVQVDGAGHLDLMLSARVFRAVHQALTEEAA